MSFLYLTADKIGEETGGGKVTRNESDALKQLGPTVCISRNELEPRIRKYSAEPWWWDQAAVDLIPKDVRLTHGYAGTFGRSVRKLKEQGSLVSWCIAAHDVEISRREHHKLGLDFPYKHLTVKELWDKYCDGYKQSDILIVPGVAPFETLCKQGFSRDKIRIIPHGVDLPEATKSFPKMFTVGYLGAYGIDKGIVYLLAAWKKLNLKDAVLVLAGRDSESQYVRDWYNIYGGGNVHFAGWQKDVSRFYNGLSLYVQPSCTEGYGIEINEAAAYGRPVICSTGAGAADLVVEGVGLRFPACNVDELAERIDWYKKNQDKIEEHGKNAREAAKAVSWDKIRERYCAVWKELLN